MKKSLLVVIITLLVTPWGLVQADDISNLIFPNPQEKIILVQELERRKWALEIHDGITQLLANIYLRLQAYRKLLVKNPWEAQQDLEKIEELMLEAIAETKGIMDDLRPSILDDIGLIPAIEKYLKRVRAEDCISISFEVGRPIPRLSSEIKTAVYRIVQESLSNIRKHAKATEVKVEIASRGNRFVAEVADNGQGFDMKTVDNGGANWGLIGMRERAEIIGGSLNIESTTGQGTKVHLEVPLPIRLNCERTN